MPDRRPRRQHDGSCCRDSAHFISDRQGKGDHSRRSAAWRAVWRDSASRWRPRSANAKALTNCQLMVLARRDVLPFLESNPAACLKLMEILCARIRHSDERMADIAFLNLPVRLAKILLSYQPQGRGATKLSLSQSELAEMTGGTREKVNRCLRAWQRQGILELKNRWTIILKPEACANSWIRCDCRHCCVGA